MVPAFLSRNVPAMTWHDEAACRHLPTAMFYPEPNERPPAEALRACMSCPVRLECDQAAEAGAEVGIWAGLSENARNERRRRARRQRGAPPQREILRELDLELAPLPKEPRHREYRRRQRLTREIGVSR